MFGLKSNKKILDEKWQGNLPDFVTVISWSADGKTLAAGTGNGDVILWQSNQLLTLKSGTGESIDCLGFSCDGKYLAAAGQKGILYLWQLNTENPAYCYQYSPNWIDKLQWSPKTNLLAFSTGKQVQIFDPKNLENPPITTLNFDSSTVLDIAWQPQGEYLAIAGYQGAKIWASQNWQETPYILSVPTATNQIAWSPNSQYLAAANQDKTLTLLEWGTYSPWVMRGFSGKIRSLSWSTKNSTTGAPLLAVASAFSVAVWERQKDESIGWEAWLLDIHEGFISSVSFQPDSFLIASAAEDGQICLWEKAKSAGQILPGNNSFTCLQWDNKGNQLAAGGSEGELTIWSKSLRGKGFG